MAAQSNVRQINEARQAEGQEEKVSKDDDDPQLIGEAKTAMNDINTSSFSDDRVAMLNGRLQSLDWTSGLDWWTGLVDSLKLFANSFPGINSNS